MSRCNAAVRLGYIKAAIATIDGSGDWHVDVSDPGAVIIGRGIPLDGPDTMVVLGAWSVTPDPTQGESSSIPYQWSIGIAARRTATSDDEETRVLDALDFADDITRAVLSDTSLGGTCAHNIAVQWREYEEADTSSAGPVVIVGEITYTILRATDSGGEGL